jgi:hypothetical protein
MTLIQWLLLHFEIRYCLIERFNFSTEQSSRLKPEISNMSYNMPLQREANSTTSRGA